MGLAATNINYAGIPVSATNRFPVESGVPTATATSGALTTVSFTRTADTNAYTAGDVIGINAAGSAGSAIHTFTLIGPAGGNIIITGWDLTIDATAIPAGMSTFRLHIYNASPTAIVDNAAFDLLTADQSKHVAVLDAITMVDYGSTLFGGITNINQQAKLATSVTSLYAELVTVGAFTPASGTAFQIRLRTIAV
jgi:hypothetical protein